MQRYSRLLQNVDARFRFLRQKHAGSVKCECGCARCCRGLFDISLPDALYVTHAFDRLSSALKTETADRALAIHQRILGEAPELEEPFFLNGLSEDRVDGIVAQIEDVRCPFLDADDVCLIYEDRPLACRFEGMPMVDARDGLFGDWCDLNFQAGIPPELEGDLCLDYDAIQTTERTASGEISRCFMLHGQPDITLFIPSVIAAAGVFRNLAAQVFEPRSRPDQK